jgi:uncharacterized membrane protein YhdT
MENTKITASDVQKHLAEIQGRAALALLPIIVFSVVQLFRYGNVSDYLLLLIGSLLSIATMFGYGIAELVWGIKKKKSFIAMFLTFAGLTPWLFGSYLVFVRGFWSLSKLPDGFSVVIIAQFLIFSFLGYKVVKAIYLMSEIGQVVSKSNIADE